MRLESWTKTHESERFLSLKARLFILLVFMVLPFIMFFTYKAYGIYNYLESKYQNESLVLAKNMAHDIDDYIVSTGEVLVPIANHPLVKSQDYAEAGVWFKTMITRYPFYTNIILVDANGDVRAFARQTSKGKDANQNEKYVNVKDTAHYKRSMASSGIAVGDFMYGKLTGKPVVHVTYPVFNDQGMRIGYVAAAFDLTKIQNKLLSAGVPSYTEIGVLDDNGLVVARNKESEKYIGRNLSKHTVFKNMVGKKMGVDKLRGPDGQVRVFGFAATSKVPWYVRAGVSETYIYRQLRVQLYNNFAVFIPLLLIAIFGWVWIGRDVDRLHKKAENLSLTDPLTALGNARKLAQEFDLEIARAKRYKYPLSFAMLDIDHFKIYNDSNGHQTGDKALKTVADIIKSSIRDIDLSYRYGGEELCIILPQADINQAQKVVDRIRDAVQRTYFEGEQSQPDRCLTISAGIASYPKDAISKEGLIRSADVALYRAKRGGRNKVELCA